MSIDIPVNKLVFHRRNIDAVPLVPTELTVAYDEKTDKYHVHAGHIRATQATVPCNILPSRKEIRLAEERLWANMERFYE